MLSRRVLAVVLISFSLQAQGEEPALGRLFTTESERRALQELKTRPTKPTAPAQPPPRVQAPAPEPVKPELPMLHGMVYRQDGRHTIWLQDGSYYLPERKRLQGLWVVRRVHQRGVELQRSGGGSLPRRLSLRVSASGEPGGSLEWRKHPGGMALQAHRSPPAQEGQP